ncbi:dnaJ homolog subfamily C member 22 isoform X2 [Anthonomus grandis grandis]|uniref:dnaJ homolog subfamily C member 22 isoform X2 n=1 Tax=Anthonomus grandis grandis TaxID=2921223 RepID=UPI002165E647|nr:dnaJ homolog subfamily C member 22 isoform X2 [Anthonomus grandis grandis]
MDTKNRKRAHPKSATDTLRSVKENSSQNHRKDDKPNSKTTKNSGKQHETELLQAIQQQWTLLNSENASRPKKSLFWAYFCWLFGGVFGLHLFYLERDAHAFLTGSTLGGYGLGWLADITKIPRYVRDCNNDPHFLEELIFKMRKNRKPPFSTSRFISAVMVGYLWGQLIFLAIPQDELYGINWNTYLHWFIPLGVALGVWVVGNIGREQGKPWLTILVSYVSYLSRWYFYDDSVWLSIVMFSAAFTFDTWSKEWRRTPKKKKPLWKRLTTLGLCTILYLSLWSSYIYFNGKITDSNGDEIPVHEAIHHFFTSSWWTDFKQSLYDIYLYAQHHGWYEIWKQVIDLSDPQGEQNAYKVLGVSPTASQQEITSRWRTLSRENHPDKCKDPDKLRDAQEKFMEIQQAYDILSNIKSKRRRKNKKSVKEDEHEL